MTERDAFEAPLRGRCPRLRRARLGDLDPAALASRITAAEPRRRGFATTSDGTGSRSRGSPGSCCWPRCSPHWPARRSSRSRLLETAPLPPRQGAALVPTGVEMLGWRARRSLAPRPTPLERCGLIGGALVRLTRPPGPSAPGRSPTMPPSGTSVGSFPHAGPAYGWYRLRSPAIRRCDGSTANASVTSSRRLQAAPIWGGEGSVSPRRPTGPSGRARPPGCSDGTARPGLPPRRGDRRPAYQRSRSTGAEPSGSATATSTRGRARASPASTARAGRRSRTWPRRTRSARLPTAPSGSSTTETLRATTGTRGRGSAATCRSGWGAGGGSPGQPTGPSG